MNWQEAALPYDWLATGIDNEYHYRAEVWYGVMPDGWRARVEIWQPGAAVYYKAQRAHPDQVMAQIWCEAALLQLQRIAVQLGELKP